MKKITAKLESLRILGEVAKANPVQRPEELCQIGLNRGYTTIVVIGADTTINNLAPLIANKKATLGVIPLEKNSSFWNLLGCTNWEEACEILPKRKLDIFDLGHIKPDRYFLTYINIAPEENKKPAASLLPVRINFGNFITESYVNEIIVTNGCDNPSLDILTARAGYTDNLLSIYYYTKKRNKEGIFSKIFNPSTDKIFSSVFHSNKFSVNHLEKPLTIFGPDNQIITKTPVEISVVPRILKIIVGKLT
jgi:diacylglycerol kinase family enzyme